MVFHEGTARAVKGFLDFSTLQAQMSPPEFRDQPTYFRVIFSNVTMLDVATIEWLSQFTSEDLNHDQRLVQAYTLHQEEISHGCAKKS